MITVTLSDWQLLLVMLAFAGAFAYGLFRLIRWAENRWLKPAMYRRLGRQFGLSEERIKEMFEEMGRG